MSHPQRHFSDNLAALCATSLNLVAGKSLFLGEFGLDASGLLLTEQQGLIQRGVMRQVQFGLQAMSRSKSYSEARQVAWDCYELLDDYGYGVWVGSGPTANKVLSLQALSPPDFVGQEHGFFYFGCNFSVILGCSPRS